MQSSNILGFEPVSHVSHHGQINGNTDVMLANAKERAASDWESFKIMRRWHGGSSLGLTVTTSGTSGVQWDGWQPYFILFFFVRNEAYVLVMDAIQQKGQGRWWKRWNEERAPSQEETRCKKQRRECCHLFISFMPPFYPCPSITHKHNIGRPQW